MSKATTVEERKPQAHAEVEAPTCRHHWVIASPQGAMSQGRCKVCGEEREFRNSANDYVWEDSSSGGYNSWRGVQSRPSKVAQDDEMAAASRSTKTTLSV